MLAQSQSSFCISIHEYKGVYNYLYEETDITDNSNLTSVTNRRPREDLEPQEDLLGPRLYQ